MWIAYVENHSSVVAVFILILVRVFALIIV
jgi:hypothetical protein